MCAAQRKTQGLRLLRSELLSKYLKKIKYTERNTMLTRGYISTFYPTHPSSIFTEMKKITQFLKTNNVFWSNVFCYSQLEIMINQTIVVLDFPASQAWHWWRLPVIQGPQVPALPLQVVNPLQRNFLGGPGMGDVHESKG